MKRNERCKLEEELRLMAMDETELDPERDAQITEWVKEQYKLAAEEKAKEPVRENRIGRRVLIVSATAVFLMILSFAYTVFTPDAVSHAKGFVHRASIWINDVLHLGYEVEVPPEEYQQGDTIDAVYYSLEEAAASGLPHPLVYLQHPDAEFQSISVQYLYQHPITTISYRYKSVSFEIVLATIGEEYYTRMKDLDDQQILWEAGTFIYWDLSEFRRAVTYYADTEISINISNELSFNTFVEICQSLLLFN